MDEVPIREDGLQIDEKRGFQERFWVAERVAWCVFAGIVVAALLGFSGGGGPVAQATLHSAGARIDYPLISRWLSASDLRIEFASSDPSDILFAAPFLDLFEVVGITPEPASSVGTDGGVRFRFDLEEDARATVAMRLKPLSPGPAAFSVRIGQGDPEQISTFVMP